MANRSVTHPVAAWDSRWASIRGGAGPCPLVVAILAGAIGCRTLGPADDALVGRALVRGPLVVHGDFAPSWRGALVEQLVAEQTVLSERLGLPAADQPIDVYLFETPETYRVFIGGRFPEFPRRRAFFVEEGGRRAIYAHWGQRVAEDLRHEAVHAFLNGAVPGIPLWLDEGLAEYFEVPPRLHGVHPTHLPWLLAERAAGRWRPDLRRLESIDAATGLAQRDYAEAWAWVALMMDSTPDELERFREHLTQLRGDGQAEPLSTAFDALGGDAANRLEAHILSLAERTEAVSAGSSRQTE